MSERYILDGMKNLILPTEVRVFKGTRLRLNTSLSFDFDIVDFTFSQNVEHSCSWSISYSGRQLTSALTSVSVFINNGLNYYVDITAFAYFYRYNYTSGESSNITIGGAIVETLNPYGGTSVSFTPSDSYDSNNEYLMVLNVSKISYHS